MIRARVVKKNLERIRPPGRGRDECSQHGQLMGHSAERDWPKAVNIGVQL
jgi:hypothetical protein